MRLKGKERSDRLLWILCTICALLLGICFDNARADSSLAYQNIAGEACGSTEYTGVSTFSAEQKGIPAQQAYVSEGTGQGSSAFIPGRTVRRASSRSICGSIFGILPGKNFLAASFSGRIAHFADGLCVIISNTVILQYIHGQDGEKASFLLHS